MKNKKKDIYSMEGVVKIEVIRDFMKKKNLSEQEFADRCRLSLKELQKVLDGRSLFEPICLLKIAHAMGVEFAGLVNE